MARRVAESWGVEPDSPEKKDRKTRPSRLPLAGHKEAAAPAASKDGGRRTLAPRNTRPVRHKRGDDNQPNSQATAGKRDRPARAAASHAGATRPPSSRKPVAAPAPTPAKATPRSRTADEPQRIAKLLARAGIASRREIERMIAEGRIALDGVAIDTPATLLPSLQGVTVDGQPVAGAEATRLFLFHKPAGCLTAERDFSGRKTIYDVLPEGLPRLMPVGRLDMTTEGLLLLTNDGEFKRRLELPSTGVERSYRARAFGEVSQAQLEELIEGIEVEGVRYGRIDANLERRTGRNQWIEMTLTEGKNREVRRVLEHLGLKVNRLIRTRYGPFELGDSAPGALVEVKRGELDRFLHALKGQG